MHSNSNWKPQHHIQIYSFSSVSRIFKYLNFRNYHISISIYLCFSLYCPPLRCIYLNVCGIFSALRSWPYSSVTNIKYLSKCQSILFHLQGQERPSMLKIDKIKEIILKRNNFRWYLIACLCHSSFLDNLNTFSFQQTNPG